MPYALLTKAQNTMKEFVDFYFDIGWLLIAVVGFGVGCTCKWWGVLWWTISIICLGLFCLHFRGAI